MEYELHIQTDTGLYRNNQQCTKFTFRLMYNTRPSRARFAETFYKWVIENNLNRDGYVLHGEWEVWDDLCINVYDPELAVAIKLTW